jgi:hypothetical protein
MCWAEEVPTARARNRANKNADLRALGIEISEKGQNKDNALFYALFVINARCE